MKGENKAAILIARKLFEIGDEPHDKVQRLQFRGGSHVTNETDLGGMSESALIREIEHIINDNPEVFGVTPPKNDIGATHWAVLPDNSVVFYRILDMVWLWLPSSKVWGFCEEAPYTLHCFDDYESDETVPHDLQTR